jgi:DNA mismatch repair protein MutS
MSSQKAKITKREKKSQERQNKLNKLSKIINGGEEIHNDQIAKSSTGKKGKKINKKREEKVAEFYMKVLDKHQKDLRKPKVTVMMQVGSFFEIYGFKLANGQCMGNVWDVASDLDIKVAEKSMEVMDDPNVKVYMAGIKEEHMDPYLEKLNDFGWTTVFYVQEKIKGTNKFERKLQNIISPGINFNSNNISNVLMYVYMTSEFSKVFNKNNLKVGIYYIDCSNGQNGVMELYEKNIHDYSVVFSELVKIITIKNPNEMVIHLDMSLFDLNNYSFLSNNELISGLMLYDKNVKFIRPSKEEPEYGNIQYKYKTKEYQEALLEQYFDDYTGRQNILEELGINKYIYGRIVLCLAMDYIIKHNKEVLKMLQKPEINQTNNNYLMLANNCLQQLDIINNNRSKISNLSMDSDMSRLNNIEAYNNGSMANSRQLTLLSLLDKTKTIMGKRRFRERLSMPITNREELESRYDNIEFWQTVQNNYLTMENDNNYIMSPLNIIRQDLAPLRDLEKYQRKQAVSIFLPSDMDTYINNLSQLKIIYNTIYKYLNNDKLNTKIDKYNVNNNKINLPSNEELKELETVIKDIENTFVLEQCSSHWNNIENNIFKTGINEKADKIQNQIDINRNFMNILRVQISKIVYPGMRCLQANCSYKCNFIEHYNSDDIIIGIDENTKLGKYLYISEKNKKLLDEVINKNTKNIIRIGDKAINLNDIELKNIKQNRYQVKVDALYMSAKSLVSDIEIMRAYMKKLFMEWQTQFYKSNHNVINTFINFIIELDITQSCVYTANNFGYTRPVIKSLANISHIDENNVNVNNVNVNNVNENDDENEENQKSYLKVKSIRHPIVEKINQDTKYVVNDVKLGCDEQDGILLFGLNAAGKSTLAKSIGINLIMAQSGMFVAATNFTYYPYNYLFTRIRNNDDIYAGLSSFEVEMKEFKVILDHSDENSLILGDELCSGTETLDATSLMASGLKILHNRQSSFIFATHLHFLTELEYVNSLQNLKYYHLSVQQDIDRPGKLIYDRILKPGNGPQSYGILVCKSMSLDSEFVSEAENIRYEIETGNILKINNRLTSSSNNEYKQFDTQLINSANVKRSKYNKNKLFKSCEVCSSVGEDIHHIHEQSCSNSNNIIFDDIKGIFHKNEKWNLVCLCKSCHQSVHSSPQRLKIDGYIETSYGKELQYSWLTKDSSDVSPPSYEDINVIHNNENSKSCENDVKTVKTVENKENSKNDNLVDSVYFSFNSNNVSDDCEDSDYEFMTNYLNEKKIEDDYVKKLLADGKTAKSIQYSFNKTFNKKIKIKEINQLK